MCRSPGRAGTSLPARQDDVTQSELVAALSAAFRRPLPGPAAQAVMAPRPRSGWPAGFEPDHLRHAAGLLLLHPVADQPCLVLTVRSAHVRHGGQVSLPGGVIEAGESAEDAALREAHEEMALQPDDVEVLGRLTALDIPVSGFRLQPVVAALSRRPHLHPSDDEVARILEVPVDTLLDPEALAWQPMMRGAVTLDAPAFVTHDVAIWGATAMVIAEFLTMLGWPGQLPDRA
jgi:8-oxo-dGTP pyrophosphatase MutT (NUDIX family)